MRKILIWLLAAVLLLLPCGMAAGEGNEPEKFESGDYVYRKLEDGSVLLWKYRGTETEITIPEELDGCPVTAVGPAFIGNRRIVSVTMPDSVTDLWNGSFCGCIRLRQIRLSENLRAVKEKTFMGCTSLREIRIPDSVTLIGREAFGDCSKLKSATLSSGLTEIGEWAFNECVRLKDLVIPEGVQVIRRAAFRRCDSLEELVIPPTVTTLGEEMLYECNNIKLLVVPGSVTELESGCLGWGSDRTVVIDRDSAAVEYCSSHGILTVWSDEYEGNP